MSDLKEWMEWVYEGGARERRLALALLAEDGFAGDARVACAVGDVEAVQRAIADDAGWVNRVSEGPLALPPLVAVTHSSLILEPRFEAGLLACAKVLLKAGADVNGVRVLPECRLSALYGAAGRTHHAGMTKLLLEAGADPYDNESLYHSVEAADSACTRLLLEAGVAVNGTNALAHVLDYEKADDLVAMLAHGGDVNEKPLVHHAILRGRSTQILRTLLEAGADPHATNREGVSVFRYALLHGREDVAAMLDVTEVLSEEEQFVAACARGDEEAARLFPNGMVERLRVAEQRVLPEMAMVGNLVAVRTMIAVGWPLEVKAGWGATALNHAVFRGDSAMAGVLLEAGADWRTLHGYKNNVLGTLSWASQNERPEPLAPADYVGCARVLLEHGAPRGSVTGYRFSPEVEGYLAAFE